jgi:DNA-binding CsgD family transcriptional regulator
MPSENLQMTSETSRSSGTLVDAVDACRLMASNIGADGFSLFFAAIHGEARRLVPVFDETFPGVSPQSRALSSPKAAPFTRHVTETTCPVWWRDEGSTPFLSACAKVWTIAAQSPIIGLSGIAFPVSSGRRRSGAIIFTGNAMSMDETALCDTHAGCFEIFDQVAQQRDHECNAPRPMSKRELECLRLTANGLTSDEIAGSLGLSVHTANQYLTNSTQKLNAVNRVHAVAKALRGGMIA